MVVVLSCSECQRIQLLIIELACSQQRIGPPRPKPKKEELGMGEIHAAALFYDGRTLDRRRLDHNFEPLHEEGEQGKGG